MAAAIYTTDFRREFEAETGRLLRSRFVWLVLSIFSAYVLSRAAIFLSYAVLWFGVSEHVSRQLIEQRASEVVGGRVGLMVVGLLTVLDLSVFTWAGLRVFNGRMARERMLAFTQWFLFYCGATDLAAGIILRDVGFPWLIGFYHMMACVLLPWTAQQAIRPMGPYLVLNAVAILAFGRASAGIRALTILFSLFAGAPGTFVAWMKHTRRLESFRVRVMQARYGEMRRELVDARRIHEALFPRPVLTGPLRFEYRYEPMRQIGGDYLYARFSPASEGGREEGRAPATRPFNVLLMDVTGHGIAAALTVNRLYGEVERLFAEDPHASPAQVLGALNKYVHLTLANHSVFVTALCIRIDPDRDLVEYASGGHPPAFLCAVDGSIEQLDSTAFVLGACPSEEFHPNVQSHRFGPGDTLLAYTDGAIESRNQAGKMLGVIGVSRILAGSHHPDQRGRTGGTGGMGGAGRPGLSGVVLAAVENHRFGPPEDDTLVVEITRMITDDPRTPPPDIGSRGRLLDGTGLNISMDDPAPAR